MKLSNIIPGKVYSIDASNGLALVVRIEKDNTHGKIVIRRVRATGVSEYENHRSARDITAFAFDTAEQGVAHMKWVTEAVEVNEAARTARLQALSANAYAMADEDAATLKVDVSKLSSDEINQIAALISSLQTAAALRAKA